MKVLRSLRRLFGRLVMVCAMLGVLLFVCILGPVRLCRAGGGGGGIGKAKPSVPDVPTPEPTPIREKEAEPESKRVRDDEARRLRARMGSGGTVLTSPLGATGSTSTIGNSLLGRVGG